MKHLYIELDISLLFCILENNDLLNYKVYWLQYLNRKEEALKLIQELVDRVPDNGTYHDMYGEILMYYEEYEEAIEKFLRFLLKLNNFVKD